MRRFPSYTTDWKLFLPLFFLFSFLLSAVPDATPHGGGLDSYGCHHDRKHGSHHCHQGQFTGRAFASEAEMQAARQENYTAVPPTLPSVHFTGKVVGISDGDTISVMHSGRAEKIRLHGIDCPEKGQAFGTVAKQFTSALVFGKEVTVMVQDADRYGRTIGEVKLLDGVNFHLERAPLFSSEMPPSRFSMELPEPDPWVASPRDRGSTRHLVRRFLTVPRLGPRFSA